LLIKNLRFHKYYEIILLSEYRH